MDWSENVSATLRSQEHGPQPAVLLFDNHSQDCRYDGPLDVAPTMQESYGTGGNNMPLVVADGKTPQLIRRLTPLECERLQGFPDGPPRRFRFRPLPGLGQQCGHPLRGVCAGEDQGRAGRRCAVTLF